VNKEISDKVNKWKQIEALKQIKQIQKEQLAKQYDVKVANAKPKVEIKEDINPKYSNILHEASKDKLKSRIIEKRSAAC
jgi:hypothetical protein